MRERDAADMLRKMLGFDSCRGLQRQSAAARVATATRRETEMTPPSLRASDHKFQMKPSISPGVAEGDDGDVVDGTVDIMVEDDRQVRKTQASVLQPRVCVKQEVCEVINLPAKSK